MEQKALDFPYAKYHETAIFFIAQAERENGRLSGGV